MKDTKSIVKDILNDSFDRSYLDADDNVTTDKTIKLIDKLKRRFPDAWFKTMYDWNETDGIWTGEGSYDGDREIFDYWNYNEKILPEFEKIVNDAGYWIEWNDAGTVHITPDW